MRFTFPQSDAPSPVPPAPAPTRWRPPDVLAARVAPNHPPNHPPTHSRAHSSSSSSSPPPGSAYHPTSYPASFSPSSPISSSSDRAKNKTHKNKHNISLTPTPTASHPSPSLAPNRISTPTPTPTPPSTVQSLSPPLPPPRHPHPQQPLPPRPHARFAPHVRAYAPQPLPHVWSRPSHPSSATPATTLVATRPGGPPRYSPPSHMSLHCSPSTSTSLSLSSPSLARSSPRLPPPGTARAPRTRVLPLLLTLVAAGTLLGVLTHSLGARLDALDRDLRALPQNQGAPTVYPAAPATTTGGVVGGGGAVPAAVGAGGNVIGGTVAAAVGPVGSVGAAQRVAVAAQQRHDGLSASPPRLNVRVLTPLVAPPPLARPATYVPVPTRADGPALTTSSSSSFPATQLSSTTITSSPKSSLLSSPPTNAFVGAPQYVHRPASRMLLQSSERPISPSSSSAGSSQTGVVRHPASNALLSLWANFAATAMALHRVIVFLAAAPGAPPLPVAMFAAVPWRAGQAPGRELERAQGRTSVRVHGSGCNNGGDGAWGVVDDAGIVFSDELVAAAPTAATTTVRVVDTLASLKQAAGRPPPSSRSPSHVARKDGLLHDGSLNVFDDIAGQITQPGEGESVVDVRDFKPPAVNKSSTSESSAKAKKPSPGKSPSTSASPSPSPTPSPYSTAISNTDFAISIRTERNKAQFANHRMTRDGVGDRGTGEVDGTETGAPDLIQVWHLPHGRVLCRLFGVARMDDGRLLLPKWMARHNGFLLDHCGLENPQFALERGGGGADPAEARRSLRVDGRVLKPRPDGPLLLTTGYRRQDLFSPDAPRLHMPHFVSDILRPLVTAEVTFGSGRSLLRPHALLPTGPANRPVTLAPGLLASDAARPLAPAILVRAETARLPPSDWVRQLTAFFEHPSLGFVTVPASSKRERGKRGGAAASRLFRSVFATGINPYEPYGLFGTGGTNVVFASNGISREPPWATMAMRERPCRVVITALTRQGPRALLGLDRLHTAIAHAAGAHGLQAEFHVVDFLRMAFREQVRVMQETHVLIATHGAGNANIIFMRPGAAVIEVFPFSYKAGPFDGFAKIFGLDYNTAMSAPQTGVFKECMRRHEKNEFIRKQVFQKWDQAVEDDRANPWVHRLEFEKEFGESGKSQGLTTRGCVRLQQLAFNIDAVAHMAIAAGTAQCEKSRTLISF